MLKHHADGLVRFLTSLPFLAALATLLMFMTLLAAIPLVEIDRTATPGALPSAPGLIAKG
jgi:hypothetical protein